LKAHPIRQFDTTGDATRTALGGATYARESKSVRSACRSRYDDDPTKRSEIAPASGAIARRPRRPRFLTFIIVHSAQ
jgi:hypothetical protein